MGLGFRAVVVDGRGLGLGFRVEGLGCRARI